MLDRILPRRLDDDYRGSRLALWILGLLAVLKLAMGANAIFNGHDVASRADGIPLATFPPDAAQTVVAIFAGWGLGQVVLALLCLVALARWRGMVPFVFALLLFENVGRKAIFYFLPYATTGSAPSVAVNAGFIVLMLVGLVLSLRGAGRAPAAP